MTSAQFNSFLTWNTSNPLIASENKHPLITKVIHKDIDTILKAISLSAEISAEDVLIILKSYWNNTKNFFKIPQLIKKTPSSLF